MELVSNKPDAWVFASENASKPMWRDNVWYRHMKPLLDPLGLSWATFQVLRRTHASLGHDAGIDPKSPPTSGATESELPLMFIPRPPCPGAPKRQNSSKTLCSPLN